MKTIEPTGENCGTGLECFLGRQPIYDGNREIQAYELLYRRNATDRAAVFSNGDQASAEVLLAAILQIDLAQVSPEQPVFINHTAALLATDPLMQPNRCVIEVLEDVAVNAGNIAGLQRLKKLGYRIALDDFAYSESMVPFLLLAHYVKLDLRALSPTEFVTHVGILKKYPVLIIAEKIETVEEFESSKALGCDLFQGYYLRKPEVLRGRRIPANHLSALSLLWRCLDPDQSARSIAAVLARDAVLLYGLLRLANSALNGRTINIKSPLQAITMLGTDRVIRWASLVVLSGIDDCPFGYLGFALQRARACEILATAYGRNPQLAYMAGLLSTLDAILNAPLAEIIKTLPLDAQFSASILRFEGDVGAILDAILAYETGNCDSAARHGFSVQRMQVAFWEAATYSTAMITDLKIGKADHILNRSA